MSQNASKQRPDYSQWPTKQQVAETLEISTKSVEKFADEGKLQTALWKRPTGGPKIAVYHPVDVEKLRRERFPGTAPKTFVVPAPEGSQTTEKSSEQGLQPSDLPARGLVKLSPDVRDFVYLLNTVNAAREPAKPRMRFLDLKASAEYTGLSERLLLVLVRRGVLHPLEEPPEKGTRYARGERLRFSVTDLDQLQDQQGNAPGFDSRGMLLTPGLE